MQRALLLIVFGPILSLLLAGCEQLGLQTPAQTTAAIEAEGRAIGSACRHSGRALEDCYTLNPKAQKAAVFTGWRDMDAYMRENSLDVIAPVIPRPAPVVKKKKKAADGSEAPAEKTDKTDAAPVKIDEAPTKKDGAAQNTRESPLPAPVSGGKMV